MRGVVASIPNVNIQFALFCGDSFLGKVGEHSSNSEKEKLTHFLCGLFVCMGFFFPARLIFFFFFSFFPLYLSRPLLLVKGGNMFTWGSMKRK